MAFVINGRARAVVVNGTFRFLVATIRRFFFLFQGSSVAWIRKRASRVDRAMARVLSAIGRLANADRACHLSGVNSSTARDLLKGGVVRRACFLEGGLVSGRATGEDFGRFLLRFTLLIRIICRRLSEDVSVRALLVVNSGDLFQSMRHGALTREA